LAVNLAILCELAKKWWNILDSISYENMLKSFCFAFFSYLCQKDLFYDFEMSKLR